jgi:hypothetical protein
MPGFYVTFGASSCYANPNGSFCGPDSLGAEIGAFILVAVIVVVAVFAWWWRYGDKESNSLMTRFFIAAIRRFGTRKRR